MLCCGVKKKRTYANDAVRSNELDVRVLHGTLGVTLAIGLDVAQVTNVSGFVAGSTVSLAVRVDCFMKTSELVKLLKMAIKPTTSVPWLL
jgi:hypothetical protein